MKLVTFKGGVHPNDGKSLAKDKAIQVLKPKGTLVYPLSQHIGAPAQAIVSVGDRVLKGQKIAESSGFVSSPIYASVSGTVKAIEPRYNPTGAKVNSIVIENDEQYEEVTYEERKPLIYMTKEEILNIIADAGIVGMGGAGFPTRVKLSPKEPEKIDYIIANCAECEPYITADYRRMLENPDELISGLKVVLQLFDNATGILAIEDNKSDCICEPYITADYRRMLENPDELISGLKVVLQLFDNATGILAIEDNKSDCIKRLEELVQNEPRIKVVALQTKYPQGAERQLIYALEELVQNEPRIKVVALQTKYPQGAERQLIYASTGRAINSSMLPADAGCVVDNVETLISIHRAVIDGKPLMERVVTVSGDAVNEPGNFLVPLGMNQNELIEAAGGFKGRCCK